MSQLPIDKQVELSDKIALAIHETIYSTFMRSSIMKGLLSIIKQVKTQVSMIFRFNYFVNQLTDNVITEDINEEKAFIYDNDEQLDWLLVNILNKVQRAADGWGMKTLSLIIEHKSLEILNIISLEMYRK